MAYTFDPANYPSVRASIGLDVDATIVPDTTLGLAVYKGEAERYIERTLTEAQYTNPAWADEAHYAATLYLAALIVPTLRVVQSERIAGGNLTYASVNLEAIAARLREQAAARLAEIQAATGDGADTTPAPHFFGVASRQLDY